MSSFLEVADLASDTDDEDYVPDVKEVEREESGPSRKRRKHTPKQIRSQSDDDEPEEKREESKNELEELRRRKQEEQKKKQIEDTWSAFKRDVSSTSKKVSNTSKTSVASSSSAKSKDFAVKKGAQSIMSSIFDDIDKRVTNSQKKTTKESSSNSSIVGSIFDEYDAKTKEKKASVDKDDKSSNETSSIDDDRLKSDGKDQLKNQDNDSMKDHLKSNNKEEKSKSMTITQVFDFAGENVEVSKEVSSDSKEAKRFMKQQEQQQQQQQQLKKSGLSSVVEAVTSKKKKLGTLDKSKMDWDNFVNKEGIAQDLKTFNKGKDGYVEKQAFLERADQRRFEIERDAREKTRKPLL